MAKLNKRTTKKEKVKRTFPFKKIALFFRGLVLLSVLLSVVGGIGFYGMRLAQDFLNRPIAEIIVTGKFQYVSEEEISIAVGKMIGGSFVGENINRIKVELESMPWVDSVDLIRQWPDRLEVVVREQLPIARWGDDGFVNVRGELIIVNDKKNLSGFSKLSGEASEAALIMQQYSVLANVFQPYGLLISELEKNRRGVWRLVLGNGWKIILGRGDVYQKVQRFTHLLDLHLLHDQMQIDVIDIRYPNGLAVSWLEKPVEVNKEKISAVNDSMSNTVNHAAKRLRQIGEKKYARG